jgi:hypothetical protein
MTTSINDFDAAKAVVDQLKGMEQERQRRILRWVVESLNLDIGSYQAVDERTLQTSNATGKAAVLARDVHPAPQPQRSQDIKTFVESKKPKSDVQFATVVAYYYRFEAPAETRKASIDATGLKEAARLANRRRPPKPLTTLNNAKKLGYLDSPERGQFRINSVGENLVAMTLPGGEPERSRDKGIRKGKRSARPKKR